MPKNRKNEEETISLFDDEPNWRSWYNNTWVKPKEEVDEDQIEEFSHSDTLVFHKNDPSTTMLRPIYEGKGWDVINDSYRMNKETIHKLLENHSRIVMLGHGSSYGLMGGAITPSEAPYLKDKDLFVIWCNADAYFNHYLPEKHGFFCTGNMPSDSHEARWVGYNVSEPYMNENITYWCQLCANVCEQCLNGDPQGGVNYIREKYWEKYGQGYDVNNLPENIPDEVGITKYNYDRTKVQ